MSDFVVVPRVPTPEMDAAGEAQLDLDTCHAEFVWAAMVEAAPTFDVSALEKYADRYVDEYEFGDNGYEPTEHERLLIADAIGGLLVDGDFMALLRGEAIRLGEPLRAICGGCYGDGCEDCGGSGTVPA